MIPSRQIIKKCYYTDFFFNKKAWVGRERNSLGKQAWEGKEGELISYIYNNLQPSSFVKRHNNNHKQEIPGYITDISTGFKYSSLWWSGKVVAVYNVNK